MHIVSDINSFDINEIAEDNFWNFGENKELLMHRIHSYPAKFPFFLIEKAIKYVQNQGVEVKTVADTFCGCGTTALEAKRMGINFWGCDINPVATLIARVKSNQLNEKIIKNYYSKILKDLETGNYPEKNILESDERIRFWFDTGAINDLNFLRSLIESRVKSVKYREFFLCAFSNILKSTSRWLTKSIKPQIDPNKKPLQVQAAFAKQVNFMLKANEEIKQSSTFVNNAKVFVETDNLLKRKIKKPIADLVITSPPYVTSYEYADLHQLSTLCLGFVKDYRELRNGSIGSLNNNNIELDYSSQLNSHCLEAYDLLKKVDKSKARSVARYFLDIEKTVSKIYEITKENGYAFFVIGNTSYKGVRIDNTSHLVRSMYYSGFRDISITKRKISGKILTPFRDEKGKFAKSGEGRKVYSHEYIIIGKK